MMAEAIVGGNFASDGKLPPERQLAEQLGINRATVRSALNRLGALGLLEPRQGAGYRILDFRRSAGPAMLGTWLRSVTQPDKLMSVYGDLFAVRRALAVLVFKRLLETKNNKLDQIQMAIEALEAAVKSDASATRIAQLDLAVIGAIVDTTDSLVFRLFLNPISEVVNTFPKLRDAIYSAPNENVLAYKAVYQAIQNGDPGIIDMVETILEKRDHETLARLRAKELE